MLAVRTSKSACPQVRADVYLLRCMHCCGIVFLLLGSDWLSPQQFAHFTGDHNPAGAARVELRRLQPVA